MGKLRISENLKIDPPLFYKKEINVPTKYLMSAGPANISDTVLQSMVRPILGPMDPNMHNVMDEVKEGLKYLFQTRNPWTFCVSASGTGGMETVLCNLVEDGDVVLVGVTGFWTVRAADSAERYGGDVRLLKPRNGEVILNDELIEALEKHKPSILFVVQGESSTGVLQPLDEFGEICRKHNCLLVVDAVASLGAVEMYMDKWKIDAVFSGSQKVLGGPPGLSPVSFGPRAVKRIGDRRHKCKVFYFDANSLSSYWGCTERPRVYHQTVSPTLLYGFREALAKICEDGLESNIQRHRDCTDRLQRGLNELGIKMFIKNPEYRLPTVSSVKVPDGVNWKQVTDYAMTEYLTEIGFGIGSTAGKTWRVGIMGENATFDRVDFVLKVFREALSISGKTKMIESETISNGVKNSVKSLWVGE